MLHIMSSTACGNVVLLVVCSAVEVPLLWAQQQL